MKVKKRVMKDITHIVSEPGDATRYDYVMVADASTFHFCAMHSSVRYPHTIDYYEVRNANTSQIIEIAEREACNAYTVAECTRSLIEEVRNLMYEDNPFITFGLRYSGREENNDEQNEEEIIGPFPAAFVSDDERLHSDQRAKSSQYDEGKLL